jgi:hypothetical protein
LAALLCYPLGRPFPSSLILSILLEEKEFFTENRHCCSQVLNFSVAYDSVLHGLGGYFECTLYKDIMLSILPATHSPGNPINVFAVVLISVRDLDPQDPHVLGAFGIRVH